MFFLMNIIRYLLNISRSWLDIAEHEKSEKTIWSSSSCYISKARRVSRRTITSEDNILAEDSNAISFDQIRNLSIAVFLLLFL